MSKESANLYNNIFSMVTLRALEYILAFILVPYLLRVLGPSNFGAVVFMQGLMGYLVLVVNYGFNLTAPRALARADEEDISFVFSVYMWARILLWISVTSVFFFIYEGLRVFFQVEMDMPLFWAVYMMVIGAVIFPVWFFQGIQQMRYITILNLIGRLVTMIGIFVWVKGPEDYVLSGFLQSCTPVFAGICSLFLIHRKFPGILQLPRWSELKRVYGEGWQIFLSTLAINLYTASDVVVLGLLTNHTIVGYYSGADKLINCVKLGVGAINDAAYPYISRLMKESQIKAFSLLRKQLFIYTGFGIIGGFLILFGSPVVVPFLLGSTYIPSILPLQIMAFVPLAVAVSNVLGYETMLPLGMEKTYSKILFCASILNVMIIVPFIYWKDASGVAVAMLVTEIFVTMMMGCVLWRKHILLRK